MSANNPTLAEQNDECSAWSAQQRAIESKETGGANWTPGTHPERYREWLESIRAICKGTSTNVNECDGSLESTPNAD